jgi:integrase
MKLPLKPICTSKEIRKDGTSLIFIQYCFSAENRTNLNTKIAIPPKYWDEKKLTIRQTLPSCYGEVEETKKLLKQKLRLAEDLAELATKSKLKNKGKFVKTAFDAELDPDDLEKDKDKVKELAGEKETVNLDIYFQIDDYIKAKKGKVSPTTITVFENVKRHLKAFEMFRGKQITFESFDFNFYDAYVDFLAFDYVQPRFKKPIIGMKLNTIGKTIKQFKIFIKDRVKRKIIPPIDLTDYKVPEEESDAIYLNYHEIATIYHADLSAYPYLIPYRDLFVLACLTGLRFSDFSSLRPEDLRNDLLHKKQGKSDHWVVIPLRQEAKEIFSEQFKESIPQLSNPDFNEKIKIIGKLASIVQPIKFTYKKGTQVIEVIKAKCDWITSHTARRSFCTNEFLAGTPVKLIMQISGHKNEKDFYRYIRITPEEAAEIMKKIWMERNGMQAFDQIVRKAS